MPLTNWLSGLKGRSRRSNRTRRRAPILGSGLGDWLLEDRCLLSTGSPVEFPKASVQQLHEVLYDGVTGQYEKTITITNNSDQVVYGFLEGQNTRFAVTPYEGTGAFDPFDPANHEYRGYFGYTDPNDPNKHYAGLEPHAAITITVPLAFWDSGRIVFSTDGEDQFKDAKGAAASGAPFYYHDTNTQAIFYGSIDSSNLTRLNFTPIYDSFDPTDGYKPTTKQWQSPVASGLFKDGQTFVVTGAGLPPGGLQVKADASNPNYITLPVNGSATGKAQQYVFTALSNESISPTDRYIQPGFTLTKQGSPSTTNGAVMWYHALAAKLPNNDAPFQLTEATFRGDFYNPKINTTTGFQYLLGNAPGDGIDANDFDLIDYDISFVDSINMPVAMAASDAALFTNRGVAPGGATESGNTVAIKTTVPHGFTVGQKVVMSAFRGADAGYNGTFTILATGFSDTTFQYTNTVAGLPTSTTNGVATTSTPAPFGWVGTSQSLESFQAALADFTKQNPDEQTNVNGLGQYFGGKGFPSYLIVNQGNIKLPAGQNLFLASPLVPGGQADINFVKDDFTDKSSIKEPRYALTTAGDGPAKLTLGGDPLHPSDGHFLGLNTVTQANQYALNDIIAPNVAAQHTYDVTYNNTNGVPVFVGKVVGMYRKDNQIIGVELDRDVPPDASTKVYDFRLPADDYAGKAIARLWYTWANYYATKVNSTAQSADGTIAVGSNVLTLNSATPGLVPGMAVTGSALPVGSVVLKVAPDNKTITLSTAATGAGTSFNFAKPAVTSIVGYDPAAGSYTEILEDFGFDGADQATALAFAESVYVVMSAWSPSVKAGTANAWNPLLTNIIGGNLGKNFLPNANTDAVNILTFKSKSVLRGVPDYTSPLYADQGQWYPDPAQKTGGQKFNAYNLNPFVWFIHEKLGLSGYAFALDDDLGNVGAGGATHLDVTIGGLNGIQNKDPYTAVSNFGVVTTQAAPAADKSSTITNFTNQKIVNQIAQFDYKHNLLGTMVNGAGVQMGTTIQFNNISIDNPTQSNFNLTRPLSSATTGSTTFSFFGSLIFTGKVLGAGQATDTIYLDSPDAYDTLQKIGPLGNIQVSGPGIPFGTTVTVKNLTKTGNLIQVQLTANLQPNLVSQPGASYGYTFGSPVTGPVRDDGFEWAVVQGLSGKFNHGTQVSQNTVDWTFTDSTTNTAWFAGISANDGDYTSGNPPAPQGLQVAFITGDSSISQTVTLGAGTYALSFRAAQRGNKQQRPQSLKLLVDGNLVDTITPTGNSYLQYTTSTFNVSAGAHTITLQGTQSGDNTALLDTVSLSSGPRRQGQNL